MLIYNNFGNAASKSRPISMRMYSEAAVHIKTGIHE
jgi:hypothetical protein